MIKEFSIPRSTFMHFYMTAGMVYYIQAGDCSFRVTRKSVTDVLKRLNPKTSLIQGWMDNDKIILTKVNF